MHLPAIGGTLHLGSEILDLTTGMFLAFSIKGRTVEGSGQVQAL
jgi:hypothetical protein